jgi:predicted enzyme related to lactoylglutathione lyase
MPLNVYEARINMPKIVHFEINADNPEKAIKFYEKVFDWKINRWGGPADYWLVQTDEKDQSAINGAIMKRMDKATTVIFIDVPSVDEYLKKVVKAGGKIVTEKAPIPGVGYSAYCTDTEGNVFGLFQGDPSAK